METNDEGINRRNIPIEFMDYIAQTFHFDCFEDVPKPKMFERVSSIAKERFTQTEVYPQESVKALSHWKKREENETPLQFAMRVDGVKPYANITPDTEHITENNGNQRWWPSAEAAHEYLKSLPLISEGRKPFDYSKVKPFSFFETTNEAQTFLDLTERSFVVIQETSECLVIEKIQSFAERFGKSMLSKPDIAFMSFAVK